MLKYLVSRLASCCRVRQTWSARGRTHAQPSNGGNTIKSEDWNPTRFRRFVSSVDTSTGPAEIVTDAGPGYLKALGNKEGPQVLAAEWVGTSLAAWLGLRTLTVAMMQVGADDEIPLGRGRTASPGPAIVSRTEPGSSWGGSVDELRAVENPGDAALFVVLDTWLRNCDRHPADLTARKPNYDNVFLSSSAAPPGRFYLMAIDHTHCFDCGRDLNERLRDIDKVKDVRVYGRFPEFDPFLFPEEVDAALRRLSTVSRTAVESLLGELPDEWEVPSTVKAPWADLICDRAGFVTATLASTLFPKR